MEKQLKIGKTIVNLLKNTRLTDTEIAKRANVSRLSVHKWKTGKSEHIRANHLETLAHILDSKVVLDKDTAELRPVNFNESYNIQTIDIEDDRMKETVQSSTLINHLTKMNDSLLGDKEALMSLIEVKDQYIKRLQHKLDELDKTISKFAEPAFSLEVDYSTYQLIVDAENDKVLNCTKLYADLYSKTTQEMINDTKLSDLVHPDDMWRLQIALQDPSHKSKTEGQGDTTIPSTWKVVCCENFYLESKTSFFQQDGIYKIDHIVSTKEKYDETTNYYRNTAQELGLKEVKS